jgi:cytochrome b6
VSPAARHRLELWLDARLDLSGLYRYWGQTRVPRHRLSPFFYLGGATMFLLLVQVATGLLLALFYRPSPAEAHASVRTIITLVPFGDLVRSIHGWSADLLIGCLIAHLFAMWILRGYKSPRDLTWMVGMLLLVVSVTLAFTGYLLPWNEMAYFSTRVGTEIAGRFPLLGPGLEQLLRGGKEVTGLTLTRFFGFHIAVLPGVTTLLLLVHLTLVQRQGLSVPAKAGPVSTMPFFPHLALRNAILWLVLLGAVVGLASLAPRELGLEADSFKAAPDGIKPPWYFLFVFALLRLLPSRIFGLEGESVGIAFLVWGAVVALFLPFVDRGSDGHPLYRRLGWFTALSFVGLTIYGWLT